MINEIKTGSLKQTPKSSTTKTPKIYSSFFISTSSCKEL